MIDIKQMSRQLELSFWTFTIPILSNSRLLHRVLPAVYDISRKENVIPALKEGVIFSVSGFAFGIVIGILTA